MKFAGSEKKMETKISNVNVESVSLIRSSRTLLLIVGREKKFNNKGVVNATLLTTEGVILHSAVIHRSETNLTIKSMLVVHETRACTTLIIFRKFYLVGLIQCRRDKIVVYNGVISNSLRKKLDIPIYRYAPIMVLVGSHQELHVFCKDQYMNLKLSFK